jgi:hypothetical protein
MSTLKVANLQNTGSGAPTVKNSSGTEVGQFCKAWVNFRGNSTVTIRDDFNVSSVTDVATGRYTINFSNAMANGNYILLATGEYEWSCGPASENADNYTTTSADIWHGRYAAGTGSDGEVMCVAVFGDS